MRARTSSPPGPPPARRIARELPAIAALTLAVLVACAVMPGSAQAADLFPVDDWLGGGLKKAGDVVFGPLKFGAEQVARLLVTIVGALADLLVPKSLVRAGVRGIAWLVQLPPLGQAFNANGEPGEVARMPHLAELRGVLTWIGLTLLPLGLIVSGARAMLAPTVGGESPSEVFGRVIVAGVALVAYDWAWGAATELSHLITDGLLGLPWVTDGVERMLETLVIGGAAGSAVAAEFVVPLLILVAGTGLLALLLVRVGLEMVAALLYVLGGLLLGLSVTGFGWRLLQGWLLAVTAVFVLPVLWAIVFCTGAALMLDADTATAQGGFVAFVAQLYNVATALAVFWVAIKLAQGVLRHAGGALTLLAARPAAGAARAAGAGGGAGGGGARALAQNATPAGLARFSENLRGGLRAAAVGGARGGSYAVRHPIGAAQAASYPLRRPVQATREAASALRQALGDAGSGTASAAGAARGRVAERLEAERHGGRFSARSADARQARHQTGERPAMDGAAPTPKRPAQTARPARTPPATGPRASGARNTPAGERPRPQAGGSAADSSRPAESPAPRGSGRGAQVSRTAPPAPGAARPRTKRSEREKGDRP